MDRIETRRPYTILIPNEGDRCAVPKKDLERWRRKLLSQSHSRIWRTLWSLALGLMFGAGLSLLELPLYANVPVWSWVAHVSVLAVCGALFATFLILDLRETKEIEAWTTEMIDELDDLMLDYKTGAI